MTTLSEKELKVKVQQRTVLRRNATLELKKIPELFDTSPPDLMQADIVLKQMGDLRDNLKALYEIILPQVSDENLENEIERAETYKAGLLSGIASIEFQKQNILQSPTRPPSQGHASRDLAPKLPKLEIAKYNGDPLLWEEFRDNCNISIHERTDLPTIDKFKYLVFPWG